jgi:hypothetical protein
MRGLFVIVIAFAIFAYDMSYNDGQGLYWLASTLGLR